MLMSKGNLQIRVGIRAEPSTSKTIQSWGCTGFDAVIGKSGLRVRALFSVINEHLKRNDNKVVSLADRRAAKVAALAA